VPRQVTAFSNTTVKRLRSLRDKKTRREEGLFLAEGLRILAEARDSGRLPEILAFSAQGAAHPLAAEIIAAGKHRLVILDELTYLCTWGWIDTSAVVGVLRDRPEDVNIIVTGRDSQTDSLFDPTIATFEDDQGAYNQKDAHGFIRLNALRLRTLGARNKGKG